MSDAQLSLDFSDSATARHRRAVNAAQADDQPTLFAAWSPNIDVHLHSPDEAIATIAGAEPERAHHWLAGMLGSPRVIATRRVAFPTARLDRLLWLRPPSQVTLDAAATAVGRALWAHALGWKPLRVRRSGQRLLASSPRWPQGMRVVDAPWTAIATLVNLGIPLDVEPEAEALLSRRLSDAGAKIGSAALAGTAVAISTTRPELLEKMNLPGLAYDGDKQGGNYRLPLLSSELLLDQKLIEVPAPVADAIRKASRRPKPLTDLGPDFPWTLYGFQAIDAGRAAQILDVTGGALLAGDMGSGKALAADQNLLTPAGPVPAGDVRAGDRLLGSDGRPVLVQGVFPQGVRELWQVRFDDRTTVVVDSDHLWQVSSGDGEQLLSTDQIKQYEPGYWQTPLCAPVHLTGPGPQNPHQAGAGLVSTCDEEARVRPAEAADLPTEPMLLHADLPVRQVMLQGALDAAGSPVTNRPELHTTGPDSAQQLAWLVASLGGTAVWDHCPCGRGCIVRAHLPGDPADAPARRIVDVTPAGAGPAVCFKVDAEDGLFLLDRFQVTHNTTVSLALVHERERWPLLVVAPLSALSTWERQLTELGKSNYLAIGSIRQAWDTIAAGQHEAVVVTYDRLHALVEVIERAGFAAVIADEIQRIRTPGSRRSRALRALASSIPIRIGLSGTPITNTVADALPVAAFLVPGEWRPRSAEKDLSDTYPGDPVESLAEHLGSLMVRRRMDDVGARLPKRNDHRILVPLNADQRKALAELEAEAEVAKESGEFDDNQGRMHAFARLQRMRQIVNNPVAAGISNVNPKVTAAVDLACSFLAMGRKGVIFCADRATFTDLGRALDKEGIGWVGIWGATPPAERIKAEKRFKADPNIKVVICTIQAGSESWSASPEATWLISTSYMYAPSTLSQMEARVYRMNSDPDGPDIEISYMHASAAGGTLDDRMLEIINVKKQLFAQVVDRTHHEDSTKLHMSMGDLVYLMTGKRDSSMDAATKDAARMDAEQIRRKEHARRTLHGNKRSNREDVDLYVDDGEEALSYDQLHAPDEEPEDGFDVAEGDD